MRGLTPYSTYQLEGMITSSRGARARERTEPAVVLSLEAHRARRQPIELNRFGAMQPESDCWPDWSQAGMTPEEIERHEARNCPRRVLREIALGLAAAIVLIAAAPYLAHAL
jgi:hypothetical protein